MTEDKVTNLYNAFVNNGYAMEPEAQFRENLKDPKKRKAAYDALVADGYSMEPFADFESNIGFGTPVLTPAQQQPAQPTATSAAAPTHTSASAPAEEPEQAPVQSAPEEPAQSEWQPTEQEKIRMKHELYFGKDEWVEDGTDDDGNVKYKFKHTPGINDFNQKSKERMERAKRLSEPLTPEGREKRKAMRQQAQLAGVPTKVMGLTPQTPAPDGEQGGVTDGGVEKPVQSGQSPVPYGVKYVDGKPVTQWLMPDGSLTTSLIDADQAEYGARTARLRHQFENRMKENGLDPAKPEDVEMQAQLDADDEYSKIQALMFADAEPLTAPVVENLWREAEEKHKADKERNANKHWDSYAAMGGGREMRAVTSSMNRHDDNISHMTRFDIEKMMDNAWARVGEQITSDCYNRLCQQYPGASDEELRATASEMARSLSDSAVYRYAVEQNTPKSTLEYFGRTVADMNVVNSIGKGLARSQAGTSGDLAAYEAAMGEYGKNHRVAQVTGTVFGMAADPVTLISGGVGSLAGKGALNLDGRFLASRAAGMTTQMGSRLFGSSLTGRIIVGSAGAAGNLATYEGLKEAESQWLHGGHVNAKTGEVEGYSAGEILKSTRHGLIMGSVIGPLSPVIGNVGDKYVKATTSTGGKIGIRTGEIATSTFLEGTIFAAPDLIGMRTMSDEEFDKQYADKYGYANEHNPAKRDEARRNARSAEGWDVWDDSMAMMLGFKAQHGIKSAPRVIASLRPIKPTNGRGLTQAERNHNRMSFEERVRKSMDASPNDLAFTADEREELRRAGYGELVDLFSHDRVQEVQRPDINPAEGAIELRTERVEAETGRIKYGPETVEEIPIYETNGNQIGVERKVSRAIEGFDVSDGYSAMEELMQDGRVSQAARAKAYYILTGRMLPMETVTGYTKTTADDGRVTINSTTADGEIVTSRTFKNEQEAKQETDNIMRQAELNTIDVGERYKEAVADDMVLDAAISEVSPGADPATIKKIYAAVKAGNKDVTESQLQLAEFLDDAIARNKDIADKYRPEAIREALKEETGIDVDAVLRKMPGKRTEAEREAVKSYLERLFPEEARQQDTEPTPEQAEAQSQYEHGREMYGRFEEGDPTVQADVDAIALRMQEAYQAVEDAFGAEAEYYMFHVNENPWALVNDPELTAEQQDAVLYYINAKAALDGVMDASNEAADRKRAEVEQSVGKRTHKDNGIIIPATMKVDDRQVYVVKGDVVMFPDGSAVDVRNSSESVVVMDAQTGEYEFTSPDQIFHVSEAVNPQDELDTALSVIEQEQMSVFGQNAVAPEEPAEGEAPIDQSADVSPEPAHETASTEEYDRGYEQGLEEAAKADDAWIANLIKIYSQNTPESMPETMKGRLDAFLYEQQRRAQAVPKTENSVENVQQTADDGFIPIDPELINSRTDENGNIIWDEPQQEQSQSEEPKQSALSRVPLNEKGKPDFGAVDADTAWDAIVEKTSNEAMAQSFADNMVAASEAELKKAEKVKTKPTTDLDEFIAADSERIANIDRAKTALDHWKKVAGTKQRRQAEADAVRSAEEAGALSGPTFDSPSDGKVNTLSADKQTQSAESSEQYTITPDTYTNKKGKTTDVHLVTFNRELTAEEKAALDTFVREPLVEGRKTPRGWYDRKQEGYMMRSEEAARQLGEMLGNEEAVADAQPMTAEELREAVAPATPAEKKPAKPKKSPINRVSLEDVMTDLSTKGETKLSDHAEPVKKEPETQHEISDDEMQSLANELRDLLGIGEEEGDTDIKFRDPGELTPQERQRIQSAGIRLAMGLVERGTTSFPDYATKMVGLLGDKIRPWLKSFYEGARWTPGYEKYDFTPTEQVAVFDVQNFDKKQADPIAQAAMIVEERKAATASEQAQKELIETRNKNRRENDKQREADTAALAEKAEAVAGEAESIAETSADAGELNRASELIDQTLDEVNDQLAVLGYYEAVEDDSKFHESYGYMLTAEKKAVADATKLAKQLVNDLGIDIKVTSATTPLGRKSVKKGTAVRANIAPAGGDVMINLPLNEGRELAIYINLEPVAEKGSRRQGDNLAVERILYRVENPNGSGVERWGHNRYAPVESTYADFLRRIKEITRDYLPESSAEQQEADETHNGYKVGDEVMWDRYGNGNWEKVKIEDYDTDGGPIFEAVKGVMSEKGDWSRVKPADGIFGEAQRVARATQEKKRSSRKKDVTLKPEQPVGDLFGGLFDNTQNLSNHEETEMGTRPGEARGQRQQLKQDTQVGGDEPRRETERPAGEAGSRSTGMDSDADRAGGRGLHDVATQPALERLPEKERKNVHNNHVERGTEVAPKSESARIKANIAAIETMKKLEASGEAPTAADMKKLRAFSGWGGLGKAFSDWDTSRQLRQLLGDKLYDEGAEMSRNSAYFTPAYIVDAMWDIARAMGFKGGRVLEGSAGIGNVLGLMPQDLSERSYIRAVEKDPTTGKMLSLLYPDAVVDIDGFEKVKIETGTYDLVITNVPFVPGLKVADTSGDADISKEFKTSIHDFCIAKNVRKLRDGGVGVFITTAGSMDGTGRLYKWLSNRENADIVGMFRMHNETFGGTNATSDIIVVRKRVNGVKSPNAIDCSLTTGVRTAEYDTGEKKKVKNVGEVPIIKTLSMSYNRYYVEHPEYMAGEMHFGFEKGDTSFRPESKGLYPIKEKDQSQLLSQWVEDMKQKLADTSEETAPTVMNHRDEYVPTYDKVGNEVKTGTMVVDSQGRICVNYDGTARPLMSKLDNKSPKSAEERIAQFNKNKVKGRTRTQVVQDYNAIKKALNDLLEYQKSSESDKGLQPKLKALNRAFDSFVATYGHLHGNNGLAWLKNDVDYPSVIALETYREEGLEHKKVFGKADIFSRRVVVRPEQPKATNVRDGVTLSIRQTGSLDTRYIAEQLGMSEADVRREVIEAGLGYENPLTHSMEAAHEYLSGNVREKMQQAEVNNEDGRYTPNITALRKVVPHNIPSHFIEFSIGSSWLRPELFEQYVKERTGASVKLTYAGGMWAMDKPKWTGEQDKSFGIRSEICDKIITGTELIEAAMTNRTIRVSKQQKDGPTISDPKATSACAAKVDEIRDDFKSWLRSRMESAPELAKEIEETYNNIFNNSAPMTIPDEYIPEYFDGAARVIGGKHIKMRKHQSKAIVRGTMQSLMLAHEVGTGKTFTLITTAMEMRRLGTAKKPMIVVQNATLGQFVASAKALYPDARILSLEDKDRNAEGRKDFYAKIRYNDWDMVVIPQSVLERIPDHPDRERRFIEESIQEKMDVIEAMSKDREAGRAVAALKKDVENLRDQLNKLSDTETAEGEETERVMVTSGSKPKKDGKRAAIAKENAKTRAEEMLNRATDDTLNFDDLGVDAILVDEAHEYKHLGFATAMQRGVKGVDPSYSKKCQGLYLKVKAVQEKSGGRNVIFATGTPISNTAAEVWTFMRYLLPREVMEGHNIWHFDDFVRNFGSIQQMLEFTTQGTYKENNRFAGYSNLPELARIWAGITDTVLTAEAGEVKSQIPELEGGQPTDLYLPQTNGLRAVLKFVRAQLKAYDEMSGQEKKENSHIPLVMYGIAKAAAIDARLVMANAPDDPHSKTNEAVRQTLRSLEDSKAYNGTVAIFADNYQRKNKGTGAVEFNLFDDIRTKLIAQGVPAEQVVIMRDGMTDKAKEKIFAKVNAGEIRVILGTTQRLGVGVNIQERLHTLMHIDAPNRPMDYWQRMGRLLRQGNMHKEMGIPVRVIRFGVEDSLDVTAYQRLKTKGAIADAIMHSKDLLANNLENRILEEEGDEFGNITAELSGSQYAMLQNQTEKELRKLQAKQDQHRQHQMYIHRAEPRLREQIEKFGNDIMRSDEILALLENNPTTITINGKTYQSREDMQKVFEAHNKAMAAKKQSVQQDEPITSTLTFDIGNVHFTLTTHVSQIAGYGGQGTLSFDVDVQHDVVSHDIDYKRSFGDIPLKRIINELVDNVTSGKEERSNREAWVNAKERNETDLAALLKDKGKPFEHGERIKELEQKLEEYTIAMQEELREKEAKYAEMDANIEDATDITFTSEDDEDSTDTPTTGEGNKYRVVEDSAVLDFLDGQPLKSGFRYAQWANMGVLPPMTAKKDGEWRPPMIFSRWEQSEEGMRKENGKADLVQGNGRTTGDVAYNPYFHIRTSPLNDQFTAAYDRPELLVIEGYYPESEETSGYHAEGAKDSVGLMDWHSGSVNGQLSEDTKVQTMLSRYFKPWRIVPWSEVADLIMERVGNQKVTFPINAVPPMLRAELAKRGAKFGDISGSVAEADVPMLNELRDRVNAGEWEAGLEKAREYLDAYSSSPEAKEARVADLSEKAHTPVRVIRTQEEIDALPTRRERRAKGWWSAKDNEVVIVLPNNVNVADVDNTFVHEVVGHKGLRALVGEKRFDEFLCEIYDHASNPIRKVIDKMTDKMVNEEADRLRVRKAQAHERAGEDVNANYYTDMAEARVEAENKREEFRKEATEEYMSDLGGRIGSEGFEKMSRDELTLWGKIKAKVQAFLDKFLRGLKIAKSIRLTDKDLSYILYKSWKNMRDKQGRGGVLAEAEDAVMRRRTGFGEPELRPMTKAEKKATRAEATADRIEELFNKAVNGDLTGKPVEIGRLTPEGKAYLEQLSGMRQKDNVSFVLNPSDLVHIHHRHFGDNEKDGRNIPLTIDDIRQVAEIIAAPDRVMFGKEKGGNERNMFFFLKDAGDGSYNLMEIYSDKKGNLTAKSFFKSKEAVSQRAMLLKESSTLTSVTDGASLSDGAKLPKFFEYPTSDREEELRFRDGDLGLEEYISKMKVDAMQANAGNLQAKRDAMRAIGGNLNHLRQAMARQREYDIMTVKSVADLARVLMDANLLDDLSKYETKRILGAINNVVGKQDVSLYVQKVMDIMVDNQLRMGANTLGRLLNIRGSHVDARGIEVQGELDPDGQRIAQVVRKATSLPKDDIDNRIGEAINRMSSTDQAIADEATLEYAGLQIARQYVEDITESKAEEKALRDSIKQAKEDKDAGQMTESAYRQYVASTEDAIRQNKIERAEAFHSLVEQVGSDLGESVERAKAWREAEKQRVEEIHHNANSDMEGRPTDEHHKDDRTQKLANNDMVRFLFAPLATFDQMLRMFGRKNVKGEGYLWTRYMRGWVSATEKEYTGYRDALKVLDAKVSEIYGKKMTWGDLFSIDRKLPKASVRFFDGGEMKDHELRQGNLLYIYMADKMSDGRMKLRRMGITEEDIEDIKNFLDPKFIELADWMQEEFLVDKRNAYNEVHKRMFGASMAAIENYFPLKILANARLEHVDVADDTTDTALPATSTGSIIKRRRNNLALDVTGANAFSVILDHLQQMERWAAFAEFNRDLNTLLSYKRFRNQVMNMSSVYGGGKTLWNNFRNVCSMAAGAYRPPIAALDKAAVNIAKGVTAAKVSFRVFTALKQFLSMPAYISDSNPMYLAANIANPIGAWRWSMKNLPLFEKRWSSRMAGDPRLLKSDMDWKMWRNHIVEIASRVGMSPNAFVDALTVAIGSHSMYQTKLAKYKRMGYEPDVAEARAKQDATILFNQTQQSSEGAFLSTMQVDRSWLSVLFTVFRNSSMSYTRQLYDSIRNLGRRFTPGYKGLSEEFMAKQMRRDGIDPDKADRNAKQEYRRGIIRDLVRVGVFGYVLQLAWNLGAYLPYLILGEDDDEKDRMWDDVWNHTMFGSIEGLTGGDVMSAAGNMWVSGEGNPQYLTKDMPLASDVLSILKKMDKDQVSAMNDVINLLVQSTVGFNPQSLTDAVVAVMDYCGDDAETSRECALLIARVLNCPQSQLDKIYFDELDASGEEASQMTPSEIAERYARYKVRRGAPLTGWAYGNEQRDKLMDKYRDRSNTLAKKQLTRETDKQVSKNMAQWLEEFEATKDRVSEIKKVKSHDEDRYYELLDELEITPEYDRYEIIKDYKRDVDALTKEWLKATTPAQRDSCVQAIIGLKSDMVRELMNTQQ